MRSENAVAGTIAISNISLVNIDPTIPTLFDFQIPCRSAFMDVQGTPTPGQTITYTLPASGAVAFGLLDPNGFILQGCQIYLSQTFPITLAPTDGNGVLNLPIPVDPTLVGVNVSSQGIQVAAGPALDMTQPTLVSIR